MIHNYSSSQLTSSCKIILNGFLLAVLCIIFPFDVFAQANPNYDSDVSTNFLSFIFGSVNDIFGGVLSGQNKLAGTASGAPAGAFVILNQVMALVAVVIIVYISLVGLVNSAHSGTALGQRWHSFFLPLRVCVGGALLLPLGVYNFAQVLAMWFILQGVNIANDVWYYTRIVPELFNPASLPSRPTSDSQQILFYRNLAAFGICIGSAAVSPPGRSSGFSVTSNQFIAFNSDCGSVSFSFGAGANQAQAITNYSNFVQNVINIVRNARPSYALNNSIINHLVADNVKYHENSYLAKLRSTSVKASKNDNGLLLSETIVGNAFCVNQKYSLYNTNYVVNNFAEDSSRNLQYRDYYNFYSNYGNNLQVSEYYHYDNNVNFAVNDKSLSSIQSNNILSSLFFSNIYADTYTDSFTNTFTTYTDLPKMGVLFGMGGLGDIVKPIVEGIVGGIGEFFMDLLIPGQETATKWQEQFGTPPSGDQSHYISVANQIKSEISNSWTNLQAIPPSSTGGTVENLTTPNSTRTDPISLIGWIGAGPLYYRAINEVPPNNTDVYTMQSAYKNPTLTQGFVGSSEKLGSSGPTHIQYINNVLSALRSGGTGSGVGGPPPAIDLLVNAQVDPEIQGSGLVAPFNFLYEIIITIIETLQDLVLDTESLLGYPGGSSISTSNFSTIFAQDPVKSIGHAGNNILITAEGLMLVCMTFLILAGVTAGLLNVAFILLGLTPVPFMGFPTAPGMSLVLTIIGMVLGAVFAVIMAIIGIFMIYYPLGILMNIYIPFLPLIIWFAGVLGWLFICVEAMVAAPLVAVALLHPDSTDVLGKAEHGLTMILNLMLRPALMVIGLVAAIYIVRIGCFYFSWGMNLVLHTGLTHIGSGGGVIGLSYLYVILLMSVISKSFSLINALPDKVIQWVGGVSSGVAGSEGDMMSRAEGGAKEGGGQAAKIGTQVKGMPGTAKGIASKFTTGPGTGGGGGSIGS